MEHSPSTPSVHSDRSTLAADASSAVEVKTPLAVDSRAVQQEIEAISPEKRPALPALTPRGIRYLLFASAAVATGILLTILIMNKAWFLVALVPFLVFSLLLANPECWAAVLRASERKRIFEHEHQHPNTIMARRARGDQIEVVTPDRSRHHDRQPGPHPHSHSAAH